MAEENYAFSLNLMQWAQMLAHLQTYLFVFSILALPETPEQKARCELLVELGYRLCQAREKEWDETQDTMAFSLSQEEMQTLKEILATLQPEYEARNASQSNPLALEHLTACRLLLEAVERHANIRREKKEHHA